MRLAPFAVLALLAACGADGPPVAPPPAGSAAGDAVVRPAGAPATSPAVTLSGDARAGVVFQE